MWKFTYISKKTVGPVLLPVDFEEAKENVSKRLEFIENEIKKVEARIDSKQSELGEKGQEIQNIQMRMQQVAQVCC